MKTAAGRFGLAKVGKCGEIIHTGSEVLRSKATAHGAGPMWKNRGGWTDYLTIFAAVQRSGGGPAQ
jgi:hypothetical protein